MINKLIFIKFGGSLITDKNREEAVEKSAINKLSREVKDILKKDKKASIIIGTGAGSFGHIQVEKYQLKKSIKTDKQKYGFAIVEDSVARLNRKVISSLLKIGIPAVSISPASIFTLSNGKIVSIFDESILNFLELGVVPVIYGDMVYDDINGAAVLSTDKQFLDLAILFKKKKINIDKIIFCGSTRGVLDYKGKTINKITENNFPQIKSVFYKNKYVDVTGGMKKKVEIALKIAGLNIKSYIIHGSALKELVLNNKISGTIIE